MSKQVRGEKSNAQSRATEAALKSFYTTGRQDTSKVGSKDDLINTGVKNNKSK